MDKQLLYVYCQTYGWMCSWLHIWINKYVFPSQFPREHLELCKGDEMRVFAHAPFCKATHCGLFDGWTQFLTHSIHTRILGHGRVFLPSIPPLALKPFWKPFSGGFYKLLCTCHDRYIARLTFNKWDKINKPFCWGERKYGSASQKWQTQSIRFAWFLKYFQVVCDFSRKLSFTEITRFESIIDTDLPGSCGENSALLKRNSSFMGSWWRFVFCRLWKSTRK